MRIHVYASNAPLAREAQAEICSRYECVGVDAAEAIVVLGGDGTMLSAIHTHMDKQVPIYGMNRGHVGFLLNEYSADDLDERLAAATDTIVHPLRTLVRTVEGSKWDPLAINDVAITRQGGQAAKLKISVDGKVRIEELIGDGLIVSTPVGSTAYNRSAGGPILPLEAPMLALTPICAFRPRHWKGAIIPDNLQIDVEVIDAVNRPVMAMADSFEIRDIASVRVAPDHTKKIHILCDPGRSWSDKLLNEQFYG